MKYCTCCYKLLDYEFKYKKRSRGLMEEMICWIAPRGYFLHD